MWGQRFERSAAARPQERVRCGASQPRIRAINPKTSQGTESVTYEMHDADLCACKKRQSGVARIENCQRMRSVAPLGPSNPRTITTSVKPTDTNLRLNRKKLMAADKSNTSPTDQPAPQPLPISPKFPSILRGPTRPPARPPSKSPPPLTSPPPTCPRQSTSPHRSGLRTLVRNS